MSQIMYVKITRATDRSSSAITFVSNETDWTDSPIIKKISPREAAIDVMQKQTQDGWTVISIYEVQTAIHVKKEIIIWLQKG